MKKTVLILCCILVGAMILGVVFTNLSGGIKESGFNFGFVPQSQINASDINEIVDNTVDMVDDLDDNILDAVDDIETMGEEIEAWADDVEEWAEDLEDNGSLRFSLFGWNKGGSPLTRHDVNQVKTMEINHVNDIDIHTVSSDVRVYSTNESEITAKFYGEYSGRNMEPQLTLSRQGDTFSVDIKHQTKMFNMSLGAANFKLDIYLPAAYMEAVNIYTTSGDINLSEREFESMAVKTVSGDIEINDLEIEELEVKTTSGDVKGTAVNAQKVIADTVSGEVEFDESSFGAVDIETTSGDVDISDISDKARFKTVSGQVNVAMKAISKDMEIKTTSGDVNILVPNHAKFKVMVKTTSGSLKSNIKMYYTTQDEHDIEGYTDENGALIDVKTTSGDIELNEK